MAFQFPDPAVTTTVVNPETGITYQWKADPGKWVVAGGSGEVTPPVTIDLLPPENPQVGDLWIHAESLIEYAWDGTQWFEVGSSCGGKAEEEEEESIAPFVNSYKLVSPDDFTGEAGTAALETDAYAGGAESYLSPVVQIARFASVDLNGKKHEHVSVDESFELSSTEVADEYSRPYIYGKFKVTKNLSYNEYSVDIDLSRAFRFVEGETIYYRPSFTGDYVKRKGGDSMEGPLTVTGGRNVDTATGLEGTVKVLNVDSGQNSSLNLRFDGKTRVYLGDQQMTLAADLKFNGSGKAIYTGPDKKGFVIDTDGVFYDGDYTEDRHVATKANFDELSNQIIELEEEIDAIAPTVERGIFKSTANNSIPLSGEFMLKVFGSKTTDYADPGIVVVELSKEDNNGTTHSFAEVEPGQLIQLFKEGAEDYGLYKIETITGTEPATTVVTFTVTFVSGFGEATEGSLARLNIFSPPEGGDASGFVLKTGDTMTGNLAIDKSDGSNDVEARLTLTGSRSSKTNAAAAIKFLNDQFNTTSGFLSFRTDGTDTWFTFNRDVDISNQGLQRAGYVQFISNGLIKHNDNDRIKFQSKNTANDGDGLVVFERPPNHGRRGITIRGLHPDDNKETDILWTYTNATGGDAVNYDGKMTADTNLVNKGYVDDNFIKSSGFTDMSASVIVRPAAGEGSNFAVYGGDGTGPNQSIFYVRDADGNTVFRAKNDGKVQAGAGSSTAFMATEDNDLTTKKYVDDEYARLLARIEELENNSGTGGGSGSMSRNIRLTVRSSGSNTYYLEPNEIKTFNAKADKLYVNIPGIAFKPQGRINISEINRGDLGPIWSFHITSVRDYYLNDDNQQIVELGVALEGPSNNGGSYSMGSGSDLYLSLVDGAWDEGAPVSSSVKISITSTTASNVWASDTTPVPNSGKIYKLNSSGNLTNDTDVYGAFIPSDYLETNFNTKYRGISDDTSGKFYYYDTDKVSDATINGVKGVKVWGSHARYYGHGNEVEVINFLGSYIPDA